MPKKETPYEKYFSTIVWALVVLGIFFICIFFVIKPYFDQQSANVALNNAFWWQILSAIRLNTIIGLVMGMF